MKKALIITAALASLSSAAVAAEGHVSTVVNLRSGPGMEHAVVTRITGKSVDVSGCLADGSWCQVSWKGNNGWASGQYVKVDGEVATVSYNTTGDATFTQPTGLWDRARGNEMERH